MIDLSDKKNLPILIGAVVVLVIVVGFIGYKTLKPPEIPPAPQANTSINDISGGQAESRGTTTPAGQPSASPAPTPSPTPSPAPAPAPTPSPSAPAPMGGQGTAAVAPPSQQQTSGSTQVAQNPKPVELYRPDPFAPLAATGKKAVAPKPRVDLPPITIYHERVKTAEELFPQVKPLPQMRVAGVLLGDRISALLQTSSGFELVRPGQTLRDGSVVLRIERDKVVLKTAEATPRTFEVRLASAQAEGVTSPTGGSSGTGGRLISPGGGPTTLPPYYRSRTGGSSGPPTPSGGPM